MDIGLDIGIGERKGEKGLLMQIRWIPIQLFQSHPLSQFPLLFNPILNEFIVQLD